MRDLILQSNLITIEDYKRFLSSPDNARIMDFLEKVIYQWALFEEFIALGLKFEREKEMPIILPPSFSTRLATAFAVPPVASITSLGQHPLIRSIPWATWNAQPPIS